MPAITPSQWDALRAEWETGQGGRALSRKYGVNEKAIRKRVEAEGWERDAGAIERIHERAQMLTLASLGPADPATPSANPADPPAGFADPPAGSAAPLPQGPQGPQPGPQGPQRRPGADLGQTQAGRAQSAPAPGGSAGLEGAQVRSESLARAHEARAELREISVEEAARAMAAAQIGQLERADLLKTVFQQMAELIQIGLKPVNPRLDEKGAEEQALALTTLMAGGNSANISSTISTWAKLAETIQTQERKALGADDRPKQLQVSGPKGGPIQTETTVNGPIDGPELSEFTQDQLLVLLQAADLIAGSKGTPPLKVPPKGPDPEDCAWLPRKGEDDDDTDSSAEEPAL